MVLVSSTRTLRLLQPWRICLSSRLPRRSLATPLIRLAFPFSSICNLLERKAQQFRSLHKVNPLDDLLRVQSRERRPDTAAFRACPAALRSEACQYRLQICAPLVLSRELPSLFLLGFKHTPWSRVQSQEGATGGLERVRASIKSDSSWTRLPLIKLGSARGHQTNFDFLTGALATQN